MSWAFELIDVHASRGGRRVLHGVDLGARMGEVTALVGPAASGKTTIFRLLAGLERPDTGAVFVAGKEISSAKGRGLTRIQRRLAVVFSGSGGLFARATVHENLTIAMRSAGRVPVRDIDRVADAELERFGLSRVRDLTPEYLSPAQARGVALARALVLRSPLVLVDGLDADLDPASAALLAGAVHAYTREHGASCLVTVRDAGSVAAAVDAEVVLGA